MVVNAEIATVSIAVRNRVDSYALVK